MHLFSFLPSGIISEISMLYYPQTQGDFRKQEQQEYLPTPKFLVFYNGVEERSDREILKLSAAFQVKEEEVFQELTALVHNINQGHNKPLLQACRTLNDYAVYTARVRKYARQTDLEIAVERAIEECIKEGVLANFLRKN